MKSQIADRARASAGVNLPLREYVRRMQDPSGMATVTLRRSDLFPVGTTVGIYPAGARQSGAAPTAAAIASAAVDAAGLLTVTNAGILSYADFVAYAKVGSEHRYANLRSTLDVHDAGTASGTGDTSSGSANLANVAATVGAFAIGQRITGPGIPGGTRLKSGSGASWVMTDKATANGTGVALQAEGASPAATELGGTPVPRRGGWRSRVEQRRNLAGTS